MALFSELRRRNVLKVALLYALASLIFLWVAKATLKLSSAPIWANEFLLLVLAIGFPVALIFAWFYEFTPRGLKKTLDVDQTQSIVFKTGQKLNAAVAVLAVLGVLALVGERLLPEFELPKIIEPIVPPPIDEAPTATAVPAEIRARTLNNGLRIIVWPDHDIPNVVMYNFVRAGSRNEYPGITGLSHFFEHMMFNGTERRAQGEFDALMEAAGGANNAYTSSDVTVYQDWFPRTALEVIFDLEADRLENLAIEPSVVESERDVVYSERRNGVDNNNFGRLYEQMIANAFIAHPYQFPVIGWPSDIENWTQQDLESYFRTYYAPNNLTMIFTGDVSAEEIFELSEKYFGPISAQLAPPNVRTVEPEQQGERRFSVRVQAETPLLHVAFHTGSATSPDRTAINVLLNILTEGESSRLHRILVEEQQVALNIGAFQFEGFDPGVAYFYLTLVPDADISATEVQLLDELRRVADDGVSETELAKAKNIMIADYWRKLSTIDGKAAVLGDAEVFLGDYQRAFSLPDELQTITTSTIQSVAKALFDQKRMTVGVLHSAVAESSQ